MSDRTLYVREPISKSGYSDPPEIGAYRYVPAKPVGMIYVGEFGNVEPDEDAMMLPPGRYAIMRLDDE